MNSDKNINSTPRFRFPGFTGEWEEKKLSDCFTLLRNNNLSRSQLNDITGKAKNIHYGDVLVNFGDILDVEKEQIPYITDDVTAEQACRESLKNGDVIIADTAEDNTVGKCTEIINIGETPVVSGLHTIPLRPSSVFAPGYLGYYMNSQAYRVGLYPLMQGVKVTSISRSAILGTNIHFPSSLAEQKKIAECLTAVDELITAQEQKVGALKECKQGLMQQLFPQLDETAPRLRFSSFEGDWVEKKLGDVLVERKESSIITEELPQLSFTIADGVIWPEDRKSNQRDFLMKDKDNKKFSVTRLHDIIYNPANVVYGAIHKNNLSDGVVSPIYKIFWTNENADFFNYLLKRPSFISLLASRAEGTVTKLKTLKTEAFLDMSITFPINMSEQNIIAGCFMTLDRLIKDESLKLDILKVHKRGLMQQLFPQPSK